MQHQEAKDADWKTRASATTHLVRTFIEESTLSGGIVDLMLVTSSLVDQASDLAPKLLQSKWAWMIGGPYGAFMAYYDALGHVIRDHLNQADVQQEITALKALQNDDETSRFTEHYIQALEIPRHYRWAVNVHVLDEVLSWPSWSNLLYGFTDGKLGADDTISSFITSHIFGADSEIASFITRNFDVVKPVEHSTFLAAGLVAGLINYFTEERTYSSFAQQYYFWQQNRHLVAPQAAVNYGAINPEPEAEPAANNSWWGAEGSLFGPCLRRRPNAVPRDPSSPLHRV